MWEPFRHKWPPLNPTWLLVAIVVIGAALSLAGVLSSR